LFFTPDEDRSVPRDRQPSLNALNHVNSAIDAALANSRSNTAVSEKIAEQLQRYAIVARQDLLDYIHGLETTIGNLRRGKNRAGTNSPTAKSRDSLARVAGGKALPPRPNPMTAGRSSKRFN
jgi:hypothetical protein